LQTRHRMAGWVLMQGTYYLTNDALHHPLIVPEVRERFGVTSGMSIPIIDSKKDVIAFFEVYNKTSGAEFTPQDVKNSLAAAQIASRDPKWLDPTGRLIALAAFSRSLTLANDLEQILEVIGHHREINFHRGSVILLPVEEGLSSTLSIRLHSKRHGRGLKTGRHGIFITWRSEWDVKEFEGFQSCSRTTAMASEKVGCVLRYHAAWRIGSCPARARRCANKVTMENRPSNTGVVRAIAKWDH